MKFFEKLFAVSLPQSHVVVYFVYFPALPHAVMFQFFIQNLNNFNKAVVIMDVSVSEVFLDVEIDVG